MEAVPGQAFGVHEGLEPPQRFGFGAVGADVQELDAQPFVQGFKPHAPGRLGAPGRERPGLFDNLSGDETGQPHEQLPVPAVARDLERRQAFVHPPAALAPGYAEVVPFGFGPFFDAVGDPVEPPERRRVGPPSGSPRPLMLR